MKRLTLTALASALTALFDAPAMAVESVLLKDSRGVPFLEARFFSTSDGPYDMSGENKRSPWNLSSAEKNQMLSGFAYWGDLLRITPGQAPGIVHIGTIDGPDSANALASTPLAEGGAVAPDLMQAVLQNRARGASAIGPHAEIRIGTLPFDDAPYIPSQLPMNRNGLDLPAITVHELAHTLGIGSSVNITEAAPHSPVFGDRINLWSAHLRDDNGRAARPGQVIHCTGCVNPAGVDVFDVRRDQGYFSGANVDEVLQGAMRGIPVRTLDPGGLVNPNLMAHIELKNSMMSHQSYRNYSGFMEAELALLQDLGYDIDRRKYFGSSIYGNGLNIINDQGYFERAADGRSYLQGQQSRALRGLGLHVYGSGNTILQRADLLSAGAGGAGIRVDGESNSITVMPSVRIQADGAYGRGVMFAYGKGHEFVQRGEVRAMGRSGIAASFDFGNNLLGNLNEYRGSYIRSSNNAPIPLLEELDGPLVENFDLTGRLAGSMASIYIADNAYVGRINIMRGASLSGDIISSYSQKDAAGAQRLTELNFGWQADAQGRATAAADPAFALRYDGNISGIDNFSLRLRGGTTMINGSHAVHGVAIAQGATLTGSSRYRLNSAGAFSNAGTLAVAPAGGNIVVTGNYQQAGSGNLQAGVDGKGAVTGLVVQGHAQLDGRLTIAPQRDWYGNGFSLSSDRWMVADTAAGAFSQVGVALASPTLNASATSEGGNAYRIDISRNVDAYSRHGADDNGRRVGAVLDAIVDDAGAGAQVASARSLPMADSPPVPAVSLGADTRALIAALDFSAADGRDVAAALRQLSTTSYGAMVSAGLRRERQISEVLLGMRDDSATQRGGGQWQPFAAPFASTYRQGGAQERAGVQGTSYGVIVGMERSVGEHGDWRVGLHGSVSGQSTGFDGRTPGRGTASALGVGLHARYGRAPHAGPYATALVRAGLEDGRVERDIAINGYRSKPAGTWLGHTAVASLAGGWRWPLGASASVASITALDYAALHRPALSESAPDGSRLRLDGSTFHSLRTRLGVEWRSDQAKASGDLLSFHLRSTWDRELGGGIDSQRAAFDAYAGSPGFVTRSEVVVRDSLSLAGGVSYRLGQSVVVSGSLSSLLRRGGSEMGTNFSANWRF